MSKSKATIEKKNIIFFRLTLKVKLGKTSVGALKAELAGLGEKQVKAVSYTHLTLPTILRV